MEEKETITVIHRFNIELNPKNNTNYKKNLTVSYLKSKGINAWIEGDNVVFE